MGSAFAALIQCLDCHQRVWALAWLGPTCAIRFDHFARFVSIWTFRSIRSRAVQTHFHKKMSFLIAVAKKNEIPPYRLQIIRCNHCTDLISVFVENTTLYAICVHMEVELCSASALTQIIRCGANKCAWASDDRPKMGRLEWSRPFLSPCGCDAFWTGVRAFSMWFVAQKIMVIIIIPLARVCEHCSIVVAISANRRD